MQLIIPMSGIGQRFIRAGYKTPKPLLEIENKPIIEHIHNMFHDLESIIFICNKEHLKDRSIQMERKIFDINPNSKVVSIDPHKKGPIYAVLKSLDYIDLNSPTIVNYCDFNCIWNFQEFKKYVKETNCDGCVVTYTGFHPHMLDNVNYAYLKMNNMQISDIQEKKPFTSNPMNEFASSGTYYFKSAHIMQKYFYKTIEEDLNVNNEYYVSLSFKPMIKDNLKLNNFNIKYFMQWGTPIDFEEYKWFSEMFKAKIKNRKNDFLHKGTLLIPSAGLGNRFKAANIQTPKPLINVSNKPMLSQVIDDLPEFNKIKIILRKDMKKNNSMIKNIENKFKNADIKFIDSVTEGQASTCLLGLEEKDLHEPLLISACDNGVVFDAAKFNKLKNDLNNDIIVWGCRNYPGARKNPHMYGWIKEEKDLIEKVFVKKQYKDPQKDPIVIGTFYFKNGGIFKKIAENMIKNNQRINNEFYIDNCINNAIDLGYKVVMFEADYYLCWGTPDDLQTYQYWQNCFNEWEHHPYKKTLDNDFED